MLLLAPPRWLSLYHPETKMFMTVYIRFSEVNESCLAADHSALQLLTVISSLKLLFTVSSKDRKSMLKRKQCREIKMNHLERKPF